MTKKIIHEKSTALHFIQEVITEVDTVKPTKQEMIRDVQMMNFKIRPLSGDLFMLAKRYGSLLEQLWRIGKTEAIIRKAITMLDDNERQLFFTYIDNVEKKMQENALKKLHDVPMNNGDKQKIVTLEIFKEAKERKKIN